MCILEEIAEGRRRSEMKKIGVFFAEGYEEIEALAVVDICRRCGIEVDMVSITDEMAVKGGHDIVVNMDKTLEQVNFEEYDMLVLPGGLGGTLRLEACEALMEKVSDFYKNGKYIGAICAAPSIFGHKGFLKGRKACSYPSFESHLEGAEVTAGPVAVDGHIITSRGMGTSIPFALAIVTELCGVDVAEDMAKSIVFK